MPQIYAFLELEWNSNSDETKNLSLKSKILDILIEVILKIGIHMEKWDTYISFITASLSINELSEIYLNEVFY